MKSKRTDTPFFDKEQRELIEKHMLKGAPEHEIERFYIVCERTGLDPFSKQIYGRVQRRKIKKAGGGEEYTQEVVIITSIDGFRAIAERSGEYRGQTAPEWFYLNEDTGKLGWYDVFLTKRDQRGQAILLPEACRVGILRKDFPTPCWGVAHFQSFAVYEKRTIGEKEEWVLGTFWNRMLEHMIAKVAEAQGIRKAFPLLAQGLYVEEEVQQDPEKETGPIARPVASTVQGTPVETIPGPRKGPEPEPAPEQKAEKKSTDKKPAPEKKPEPQENDDPFGETEAEPDKKKGDWEDHIIKGLTTKEFENKRLGDLTPEQITRLKTGWVDKYKDKITANPVKIKDAAMIDKAFAALKSGG